MQIHAKCRTESLTNDQRGGRFGKFSKGKLRLVLRVARGSGSSFYRAFWLLEKPQRVAMFALYAFARITDDLGDGPDKSPTNSPAHTWQFDSSIPPAVRLSAWSKTLSDKLAESVSRIAHASQHSPDRLAEAESELRQFESLWPALRDTIMRYGIPPSLLQELIEGVAMDGDNVRFATWDELDRYAYRVASTVGLACTRIWQAADTLPSRHRSIADWHFN